MSRAGEVESTVRTFRIVIEHDLETGTYVGEVPGWPGAYTQGASTEELLRNLREVIEVLLEDGEPIFESEFELDEPEARTDSLLIDDQNVEIAFGASRNADPKMARR